MQRIAEFEEVKFSTFVMAFKQKLDGYKFESGVDERDALSSLYSQIDLPTRKTAGSAGYDFMCPFDIDLEPFHEIVIPTGIKCRMEHGWVLKIYPRSSLGFKYHVTFANTVGIIDSDYYGNSDNEGHILLDIVNGDKPLHINRGGQVRTGNLYSVWNYRKRQCRWCSDWWYWLYRKVGGSMCSNRICSN